jgi:iron(III) transport system substrate-binding protein
MSGAARLGIALIVVLTGLGCAPSAAPPLGASAPAAAERAARADAPSDAGWESVVAAARQEGRLLVINHPSHRLFLEYVVPIFREEFGIEVEVAYLPGRAAYERVLAEAGAGQVRTDIAASADHEMASLAEQGLLEPSPVPGAAGIASLLRGEIGSNNTYYPHYLNVYGLLVNTRELPPERVPQRWTDLVDPYYRGNIALHNPGTAGGGNSWFYAAHEAPTLGRAYLEQFARQNLMIVTEANQVQATVARGERAIGVPGSAQAIAAHKDAPLRWTIPAEGVAYSTQVLGIPRNAPHPNAAKVWVNFMLSKRVQEWLNQHGYYTPVRDDVELENPEFNLANMPILGPGKRPAAETGKWLALGAEMFSR